MTGSYDYRLVALSVFIAILASYAALDLAGRVTSARAGARFLWLVLGAIAMGIGIWSMHYVGMLALHLPIAVRYDWPTVLLSLLAAILASVVALFTVSRQKMDLRGAAVGSLPMGGGIAAMHYIGMAAMRLPATCSYAPGLVALSVVLAVVISFVAIWLAFHFREETSAWGWRKTFAALLMGAAIPVMHYTGMAAAHFVPAPFVRLNLDHAISISSFGMAGIALMTTIILGLVFASSLAGRRFNVQVLELESSEQGYRQIIDAALDAFVGMDAKGLIIDWNPRAEIVFGWSRQEAIGEDLSLLIIPPRYRDAHKQGLRQFLVCREGPLLNRRNEVSAIHRDGREFPIELTITPIRRGETYHFSAFVRDVTERRRGEEEQRKAREAAEASSRAKSEFLANMSHEIRTPLNGVIGMTALVLETELSSEQREFMEMIKLSADSLLAVVNDVLDFSKIEAGQLRLEAAGFNLRENMEAALKTFLPQASAKGLRLRCEMTPHVPELVWGDSGRLSQIITNLVGNAIKFTPKGEVSLKVQLAVETRDSSLLHFTVSDSGIGISPDKQRLIFQAFAQADTSSTRKYGGTGLGLTISNRLVEKMGGTIWVESEVGKGSNFHFTAQLSLSAKAREVEKTVPPEILRA